MLFGKEYIPAWSEKFKPCCDNCQSIQICRKKVYGTTRNLITKFILYLQLKSKENTMSCYKWTAQDVLYYARDFYGNKKPPMKAINEIKKE